MNYKDLQEIKEAFIAGFICAGGEASEAISQADQYLNVLIEHHWKK